MTLLNILKNLTDKLKFCDNNFLKTRKQVMLRVNF